MGIRKEIKTVIAEHAGNFTSARQAINLISNIVNRAKPPKLAPSRAALAEEAIATAHEHVTDETGLTGRRHPVLILTLTHFCDEGAIKAKVEHTSEPDRELVALALATLNEFSVAKFGAPVEPLDLIDAKELLKKF